MKYPFYPLMFLFLSDGILPAIGHAAEKKKGKKGEISITNKKKTALQDTYASMSLHRLNFK